MSALERNARLLLPSLRWPIASLDPFLRLAERGVAGFCVFGGDSSLIDVLARLQAAAPHPLLFASDIEDGVGHQLSDYERQPPAASLDPAAAELAAMRTAVEARRIGFTMAFAPVCDVVSERTNPIIQARAFRDPVRTAPSYVRGAHRMGMRTCAKHFPGHGATVQDSHDSLPLVTADRATWFERDLPPFRACIEAGVDAIMSAHIACPALTGSDDVPATLSRTVMVDLLRDELGFTGLAMSDALCMDGILQKMTEAEAARAAIEAGCDLVICPDDIESVLAALATVDVPHAHERIAACATPLPDPLAQSVADSLTSAGDVAAGPGDHPLLICDVHGQKGGAADLLGALSGCRYRCVGPDGSTLGASDAGAPGLDRSVVAILRGDRAWSGGLQLPEFVREQARTADVVWVCGPAYVLDQIDAPAWIRAAGQDAQSLRAVLARGLSDDLGIGTRFRLHWALSSS